MDENSIDIVFKNVVFQAGATSCIFTDACFIVIWLFKRSDTKWTVDLK